MPSELIIGLGGPLLVALGYFLRPLGEFVGEVVRDRREEGKRRTRFQYETLIGLADAIQTRRSHIADRHEAREADATWESLTFRVADDELRRRLEAMMVAPNRIHSDEYGNVLRRLGELLREM